MVLTETIKQLFLLDPAVTFLNHGSFGALPKEVLKCQLELQKRMERQPVAFLGRDIHTYLESARESIGKYLHTDKSNLVFVPNTTHGINIVAHSLPFKPGAEILGTDHEYGAMERTWAFVSKKNGWLYRRHPVSLPVDHPDDLVDELFADITPQTKAIFISHISSPTSILFPIKEICRRARENGILTIIDGAHAPGQIVVDLDDLGPDFYTGNFHKWLCAPKGSAFLYARPSVQTMIEPLVVSWGYESETPGVSTFQDYMEWTGTQDFSAYLSVPAAIEFQSSHDWNLVRTTCHLLAANALSQWAEKTMLLQLYASDQWFAQMVTLPIPNQFPPDVLQKRLLDEFHIEIPVITWQSRPFVRLSVQGYNSPAEIQQLLIALQRLFF